jgi:hypothetical protein
MSVVILNVVLSKSVGVLAESQTPEGKERS